jgi:hypothetical protein
MTSKRSPASARSGPGINVIIIDWWLGKQGGLRVGGWVGCCWCAPPQLEKGKIKKKPDFFFFFFFFAPAAAFLRKKKKSPGNAFKARHGGGDRRGACRRASADSRRSCRNRAACSGARARGLARQGVAARRGTVSRARCPRRSGPGPRSRRDAAVREQRQRRRHLHSIIVGVIDHLGRVLCGIRLGADAPSPCAAPERVVVASHRATTDETGIGI